MARYVVKMDECRVVWLVDAESPEAAEERAWERYERGEEPDEIDCNGSRAHVREAPRSLLADLLKLP